MVLSPVFDDYLRCAGEPVRHGSRPPRAVLFGRRRKRLVFGSRSPLEALAQRLAVKVKTARRLEQRRQFSSASQAYVRLVEDCRGIARLATLELGTAICRAANAAIRAGRPKQGVPLLSLGLWYVRRATGDFVPESRATFRRKLARAQALAGSARRGIARRRRTRG